MSQNAKIRNLVYFTMMQHHSVLQDKSLGCFGKQVFRAELSILVHQKLFPGLESKQKLLMRFHALFQSPKKPTFPSNFACW